MTEVYFVGVKLKNLLFRELLFHSNREEHLDQLTLQTLISGKEHISSGLHGERTGAFGEFTCGRRHLKDS